MAPVYSDLKVHLRPDRSITQFMLENVCNTDPEKVICEDTLTEKQTTYGGIRGEAFRVANELRNSYGLEQNDIVSIISRSCVDYILATHAIWAAGGIVSTINHSNTAEELAFAIKVVKPKLFIVDFVAKKKLDEAIRLSGKKYESSKIITLLRRTQGDPLFPDDFLRQTTRISPNAYVLDGQDARKRCAAIVLSSGTSGLPKAVMLSHHNLIAICEMLRYHNMDNWRGDMREVFFPVSGTPLKLSKGNIVDVPADLRSSLYHIFTDFISYILPQVSKLTISIGLELLQDKRATLARLVPTVALALSESPIVTKYKYPDLEYFSCAGAVLKPNVAAKLREKFPRVALCQTYGCTETSSCISQSGVRDEGAPLVATGTLLANIGIRFLDDQLQDVPIGQPGEICVSTPTIMMGYKDNEAATRESMLAPGWYRTGDVGYLDQNGYLIIVDRIKDVIKYKGFQVSPSELEEIIGQHPLVQDVGVTSTWDDSEATELPRAFVVPTTNVRLDDHARLANEIQNLVAGKAAGYKKLRGGVKLVNSLPRNPTGKLLRRQLGSLDDRGKLRAKI
ncbi:uncharacterized protein Z518_05472 [Rhinocladiella mackenziei CBS 650.93]|uniref:Rhinocladiella mackenziei CBS 650.93 unplaced genomic scaffold supercont1.4, whole genome shotgun sequence n=1 Tax=Rhinocladiella mackenziei CBS 650.93 TaxID=1442369 RepID=A0A0D2FQY9_9EURO|nr:uncharacterized protein Z518_05472 [Rhinocladiella mackenziei CBS 650.93]KIX04602.1 hypothetical protein Z518_05472 [Rhinocladiella mackenziei CBS 650.93]